MRDQFIILAASYSEGRKFAGKAGLLPGAIVPVDASRVQGLRPTVILELPSYATRRDRHAIDSILRPQFSREVLTMLVDPADLEVPEVDEVPAEDHQTTVEEQIAAAEMDRLRGLAAIETAGHSSLEQVAADAPKTPAAEKPAGYKPRSRKRST